MKTFTKLSAFLFLLLTSTLCVAQTSRTWDGSSSSAWNTAANWTPSGVPASTDHVTIVSAGNSPVLSGNVTVTNFTITSGTLDLGGHELTTTGNVSMTGGTVSNGALTQSSTGTTTITGVTVNCALNIDASDLSINTSRFKQETHITKTDGPSNTFSGNVWEGNTSMSIFGSGAILTVGYSQPDTFLLDASFENEGRGFILGTSSSAGAAVFTGTDVQNITITGSRTITARRVTVNKPSGKINLVGTLSIYTLLTLKKGIVDAKNGLVYMYRGSAVSGTSNLSYIDGAVEKRGNTAFTFPVGKNGVYRPISITAPSSSSHRFKAEYFQNNSDNIHSHSSKDGSLNYLSTNEYWELTREYGSSTPKVTLSWDTLTSCGMSGSLSSIHVAGWDGSNWDDLGNGATTGNIHTGTVQTSSAVSYFNMFTLEHDNGMNCYDIDFTWIPNDTIWNTDTVEFTNTSSNFPASFTYVWEVDHCWSGGFPSCGDTVPFSQKYSRVFGWGTRLITLNAMNAVGVVVKSKTTRLKVFPPAASNFLDCNCIPETCDFLGNGKFDSWVEPVTEFSTAYNADCWWRVPDDPNYLNECPPITWSCPTWVFYDHIDGAISNLFTYDSDPDFSIPNNLFSVNYDVYEPGLSSTNSTSGYSLITTSSPLGLQLGDVFKVRTYLSSKMMNELNPNQVYNLSFDARLSQRSNHASQIQLGLVHDEICERLNDLWVLESDFTDIQTISVQPSPGFLTGFDNWHSVDVDFTASENWSWMYLGNFAEAGTFTWIPQSNYVPFSGIDLGGNYYETAESSYFIDNVSITAVAPEITQGASITVCTEDLPLTLNATGSGTGSNIYTWTASPADASLAGQEHDMEIEVSPTVNTTYTVTVEGPNGCELTDEIVVTVLSAPSFTINGPDRSCISNNNYNFSVSGLTGVAGYTWSLPSGATYVSGQGTSSYTITDVEVEGYQVELTVNYTNGCSVTETYEVTSCCIIPGEPNVVNETFPFGANPGLTITNAGTTIANQTFTVNGTWTVTAGNTLVLDNCEIALGPDAKIIVPATSTLRIVGGSHLHACDEMWNRIEVANGATIDVSGYSLIEDAETALHIYDGANTKIQYATFNRNWLHILIVTSFGTPVDSPPEINNCKFLCQSTASIGGTAVYENLHSPYSTDITNYGVNAVYARSGNIYGNEFSNGHYGIFAYNTPKVSIDNNIMRDMSEIGMYITQCGAGVDDVDIVNNTINRTPYGIFCYDNPDAELKIKDNVISYVGMASPTDTMTGIFVVEITPGDQYDPNTVSIHNNKIYKAPSGIHTMNLFSGWPSGGTGNVYIGENEISLLQPSPTGTAHSGILAENLTLGLIIDNEVYQHNSYVSWWETAIRIGGGVANQLYCNYTHDIGNGLWFDGNQQPLTQVVKNKMKNNHRGLSLNWGKIGQQGSNGSPHDNEWLGYTWSNSNPNTQAYGGNGTDSPFYVQSAYPYNPQYNGVGAPATIPIPITTTSGSWSAGCAFTAPSFKTGEAEQLGLSDALSILSTSEEAETDRERGLQWAGEYGLYRVLLMDEELRHADNDLASFFDEKDHGSMGKLYRALSDFNRLRSGSASALNASIAGHLNALQSLEAEARPEQRMAEVLGILYLNINGLKAIGATEQGRLREIAQLCPIDDGLGVYIARAALLKLDTLPRMYSSECEQIPAPINEAWKAEQMGSVADGFKIYPNPNSGLMTLEYTLEQGESGHLEIFNAIGQTVYSESLKEGMNATSIELKGINTGLYSAVVTVNGQRRMFEKVGIFGQ